MNLFELDNLSKKENVSISCAIGWNICLLLEIMRISRCTSRRGAARRGAGERAAVDETTRRRRRDGESREGLLDARDPETRIARPPPHRQSLENRRWHHGRSISPEINIPYIDIPSRLPGTRVDAAPPPPPPPPPINIIIVSFVCSRIKAGTPPSFLFPSLALPPLTWCTFHQKFVMQPRVT